MGVETELGENLVSFGLRQTRTRYKLYHQEFDSYLTQPDHDLLGVHPRPPNLAWAPWQSGHTIFQQIFYAKLD